MATLAVALYRIGSQIKTAEFDRNITSNGIQREMAKLEAAAAQSEKSTQSAKSDSA